MRSQHRVNLGAELRVPGFETPDFDFEVSFTLTPGNCVWGELYEEHAVTNFRDAVEQVFRAKRERLFLHYRVYIDGYRPTFYWDVSWPLWRRGSLHEIKIREKLQGDAPWEEKPDNTFVEIWNDPQGVYGLHSVFMVRAGGRTHEETVANWYLFAKAIRTYIKNVGEKE